MKDIAVIVYIPNKDALIRQFFGLYCSVMIQPELRRRIDFIIGCEPGMESMFERDNCIVTHCHDLSKDKAYQFRLMESQVYPYINSWSHFVDSHSIETILEYHYALRIDVDTFISPGFLNISIDETEILTGNGGYIGGQITMEGILRVAQTLNMNHRGIHNIGSTWYASSQNIIEIAQSALDCAQHLLQQEFTEMGDWPDWYALVATMYAGEIAINNTQLKISKSDKLDAPSTSKIPVDEVYSIHCWHTDDYFSKHQYQKGRYDDMPIPEDIQSCRDYSFFCARLVESFQVNNVAASASLTAPQAIRTAFSLLSQAIPMLPAAIKRKYFN